MYNIISGSDLNAMRKNKSGKEDRKYGGGSGMLF